MNRRALQHPAPREDVVVEEPGQHSCRVQRKVVAQSRVPTKTAAPQQSWRLRRTGGDDDRVGQHVECGAVGLSGFAGQVGFGGLAGGHIHRGGQVGEKGRESL